MSGFTITGSMTFSGGFDIPFPISTSPPAIDYLVVAGGGGGGGWAGGGGGAGGFLTATGFAVADGYPITVTVGAGGSGAPAGADAAYTNGNNSVISYINSFSFNGTTQYLSANNAALGLGTGNFTVEAWVYTTVSSGTQCVYDTRQTDGTTTGFYFGLYASNTLLFYTGGIITINAGTVPINTWTHIALVRVGNTFTIYLNGTSVGTATNSNNFTNTIVQIGSSSNVTNSSANYYAGYLSNLRTAKGVAVYTGNFTVPTSPLTATQSAGTNISAITGVQTSLLTLQNATIVDNSTYAVTITNNNGVAFSNSNPFNSFASVNSIGGGRGGNFTGSGLAGQTGGSGGGGSYVFAAGNGTASQGNSGGAGAGGSPAYGAGGGGGASATGTAGSNSAGGVGGNGTASSITGASVTYAGGGGGGNGGSGTSPAGGSGGGGAGGGGGGGATGGFSGTVNTGGGGGGAGSPNTTGVAQLGGGAGGSGVVVIRYADTYAEASATTGSPTVTVAGGYIVYAWITSGTITWPTMNLPVTSTVEYLVVAGGGGGGGNTGAGAGAGGLLTASGFVVASGSSITITVGAGGAAGQAAAPTAQRGINGNTSSLTGSSAVSATGGGGSAGWDETANPYKNGGSGAGRTGGNGVAIGIGIGTVGQGYDGGLSSTGCSGGGGGAGAVGGNASDTGDGSAGVGGIGVQSNISGSAIYYAGGGGGGGGSKTRTNGATSGAFGAGGNGGGGAGTAGNTTTATSGSVNTGGGGGGGGFVYGTWGASGGAGGSGIVIIRYTDTSAAATATTGSPTITVAGGYRVYKWTSSGSITF